MAFSVAMGALEGIVVVYLRELYYPDGFSFPLRAMPERIYAIEILREACTLVMLAGVAALAARGFLRQFAVFLWTFAMWDVVYYVLLKWALDWPESLFTWDILFLIPIPWVGPVAAPLLYCIAMSAVGAGAWRLADIGLPLRLREILLMAVSACLVLYAFMEEPFRVIATAISGEPDRSRHAALAAAAFQSYIPQRFLWPVFLAGWASGLAAAASMLARAQKVQVGSAAR